MTESEKLLADYVTRGSQEAFRELVARYVNLVYSTALRLVAGDTHRAQDIAQTVFANLARNARARSLPTNVMVGGLVASGHLFRRRQTDAQRTPSSIS
jgi:hypothetical protein